MWFVCVCYMMIVPNLYILQQNILKNNSKEKTIPRSRLRPCDLRACVHAQLYMHACASFPSCVVTCTAGHGSHRLVAPSFSVGSVDISFSPPVHPGRRRREGSWGSIQGSTRGSAWGWCAGVSPHSSARPLPPASPAPRFSSSADGFPSGYRQGGLKQGQRTSCDGTLHRPIIT